MKERYAQGDKCNRPYRAAINGKEKTMKEKLRGFVQYLGREALKQDDGIDGILVSVGLCVIALLLCVVMKDSLSAFIQTIVSAMTNQAQQILSGVSA